MRELVFLAAGYLSGSVLYARIFGLLLAHKDITEGTKDGNPGTANAFQHGGLMCGTLTLICELLKGFLPVYLYLNGRPPAECPAVFACILAAPVLGHAFPAFFGFHGGKGIAVSFGCLLGLYRSYWLWAALLLAVPFLFFSLVLRVTPHFYRTVWTYVSSALLSLLLPAKSVRCGMLLLSGIVLLRLHLSTEIREKMQVRMFGIHAGRG